MNTALLSSTGRDAHQHQKSPAMLNLKINSTSIAGITVAHGKNDTTTMTAPSSADDDDDDYSLSRFVPGTRDYLFPGPNQAAFSASYDAFFAADGYNDNCTDTGENDGNSSGSSEAGGDNSAAMAMLYMDNESEGFETEALYERSLNEGRSDNDPRYHQHQNRDQSLYQSQYRIQQHNQNPQEQSLQQKSRLTEDALATEPTILAGHLQRRHRQPSAQHQQHFSQSDGHLLQPKFQQIGPLTLSHQIDEQQEHVPYHYQQANNNHSSRQEYAMDLDEGEVEGTEEQNEDEIGEGGEEGQDEDDDNEYEASGKKRKTMAWKQQQQCDLERRSVVFHDESDKEYEHDEQDPDDDEGEDAEQLRGGQKNKRRRKSATSRKIRQKLGSSDKQIQQQQQQHVGSQSQYMPGQLHQHPHQYQQPFSPSSLSASSSSSTSLSPAPTSSAGHCSNFITEQRFLLLAEEYLLSLSPKKREKALLSNSMYQKILMVLIQPKNTQVSTAQFRFWAKKMFTLSTTATHHVVCHGGKPVATKECLYDVLVYCHRKSSHGGRDKTSAEVRQHYSWVPKELIARFVKHCPLCLSRRSTQQRQGGANGACSIPGTDLESVSSVGDQLQDSPAQFPSLSLPTLVNTSLPHHALHRHLECQVSDQSSQSWAWQNHSQDANHYHQLQSHVCKDSDEERGQISEHSGDSQDAHDTAGMPANAHDDSSMQIDGEGGYAVVDSDCEQQNGIDTLDQSQNHYGLLGHAGNIPSGMVGISREQPYHSRQQNTFHQHPSLSLSHSQQANTSRSTGIHYHNQHHQQQHHTPSFKPLAPIVPVAVHPNGHILHDRHPIHNRARLMGLANISDSTSSGASLPMSMPMSLQMPMPMGRLHTIHNPFLLSAPFQHQYQQHHSYSNSLGNHARVPGQHPLLYGATAPGHGASHEHSQIVGNQGDYDVDDNDSGDEEEEGEEEGNGERGYGEDEEEEEEGNIGEVEDAEEES